MITVERSSVATSFAGAKKRTALEEIIRFRYFPPIIFLISFSPFFLYFFIIFFLFSQSQDKKRRVREVNPNGFEGGREFATKRRTVNG